MPSTPGDAAAASRAPVELVPVTPEDAPLLLGLARAFHAEDGHPLDAGGERAVHETCAGHPLVRGYLLRAPAGVVGYCVLTLGFGIEYGGADIFLDDLYLLPEARGRGLGAAVLALAEAEARRLGARAIHLVVAPENERAQQLYARSGFHGSRWQLMSKRL